MEDYDTEHRRGRFMRTVPVLRASVLVFSATIISLAIAGCARPRDENLAAFAASTTALSGAAKNAGDLNVEIDGKTKLAKAAAAYASGGEWPFPAGQGVLVAGNSDADWKAVLAFFDAVSGYAQALQKANDPKLESDVSDKLTALSTALAKATTARDAAAGNALAPARQQRIQAIGGVVVDIVSIASNIYVGIAIQGAMAEVQPQLDLAREPLSDALREIIADDKRKLDNYFLSAKRRLAAVPREGGFVSRYDVYVAANQDYQALATRVAALNGMQKAVDQMIEAHRALMSDLDNRAAMVQFLQTVSDIADKLASAEALRKQT